MRLRRAKDKPAEPLTRDQAASAIHKIVRQVVVNVPDGMAAKVELVPLAEVEYKEYPRIPLTWQEVHDMMYGSAYKPATASDLTAPLAWPEYPAE